MKQVIRVEHPDDGKGIWRSEYIHPGWGISLSRIDNHSLYRNISDRHQTDEYPSFKEDSVLSSQILKSDIHKYHFAFLSIDQLKVALTSDELKECINSLGFKVLMYTVVDYFESPYQVVFLKETAIKVEDISSLFL